MQGYESILLRTKCQHLRQIRGDNYCAIRAVLFQILAGEQTNLNLFAPEKMTRLENVSTVPVHTCMQGESLEFCPFSQN